MDAVKKPGKGSGSVSSPSAPASKVRRLGRGLSSLVDLNPAPVRVEAPDPSDAQATANQEVTSPSVAAVASGVSERNEAGSSGLSDFQLVAAVLIEPSRFQPRKTFDEGPLLRLADSIKRSGLMQPVIVRPLPGRKGRFELIAGERRWRAAQAAGLTHVPALVRELDDEAAAEWGLVENVQREDLNAMDRAWALRNLLEKFHLEQSALAERVGLERSTVANLVRLTELEPELAHFVANGSLSAGHGKALLTAPSGAARSRLAEQAMQFGWSVRRLETEAQRFGGGATRKSETNNESSARQAVLRDLERQIGQQLATKVQIRTDRRGKKGSISFEFYGLDHFEGLLSRLHIQTQ